MIEIPVVSCKCLASSNGMPVTAVPLLAGELPKINLLELLSS